MFLSKGPALSETILAEVPIICGDKRQPKRHLAAMIPFIVMDLLILHCGVMSGIEVDVRIYKRA